MHQIMKHAKEVPAPNKYTILKNEKIKGFVGLNEAKKNILDDAEYLG